MITELIFDVNPRVPLKKPTFGGRFQCRMPQLPYNSIHGSAIVSTALTVDLTITKNDTLDLLADFMGVPKSEYEELNRKVSHHRHCIESLSYCLK